MKPRLCISIAALMVLAKPGLGAYPPAPDHKAALEEVSDAVRAAQNEAKAVLDRGMEKRSGYDFLGAVSEFTRLIEYGPLYAEGCNQRAFAYFLRQDFVAAQQDLDRALTRLQLGELDTARVDLRAALALNPWLSERHLLAPGAALAPPGDDI